MTTVNQYDYEVFAERISQVIGRKLTEDEIKRDFPELEYTKLGEKFNGNDIVAIDNFVFGERALYEIVRTSTEVTILKVAQFGPELTAEEKKEQLVKTLEKTKATIASYETDASSLMDPHTGEPFESDEERDFYVEALKASISMFEEQLETQA